MNTSFSRFLSMVEDETGMSTEQIKARSPDSMLETLSRRFNRSFEFASFFPVIGRGSVLRDFYTTKELDAEVEKAIETLGK